MTFTRYFNADIEDANRIAVVTVEHEEDFAEVPETEQDEIKLDELPADFANWNRYTASAHALGSRTAIVDVRSRDGD